MPLPDDHIMADDRLPVGLGGRWYGVYTGVVADAQDPAGQGRVLVRLPWAPDTAGDAYEAWARLATLMAGPARGTWLIPEPGDEVLLAFAGGEPSQPVVIGSLWNGARMPPEDMTPGNDVRAVHSRNGIIIRMTDTRGTEALELTTPGGQTITLRDGPGSVEIADANGNDVTLDSAGITVNAAAQVRITAASVELSAGTVTVNAGMSRFSGVVQADTVITNSVISASYTPGAGNIW